MSGNYLKHSTIIESQYLLRDWLFNFALPIWDNYGRDQKSGGFYERLHQDLSAHNITRRTRVCARQIFTYGTAHKLGSYGKANEVIDWGIEYLEKNLRLKNGFYAKSSNPDGSILDESFELYDHAFIILAASQAQNSSKSGLFETNKLIDRVVENCALPQGGFAHTIPVQSPLQSNPHMHLFEASIAMCAVSENKIWRNLCSQIVNLLFEKFVDKRTGGLFEYFEIDWQKSNDGEKRIIEPGHHFEWAWLVLKWAPIAKDYCIEMPFDPLALASKLVEVGERHGFDNSRGVVINSLNEDLTPRDTNARLWPQTERIKAYCELSRWQTSKEQRDIMIGKAHTSVLAILRYFEVPNKGLYWDEMDAKGNFLNQSAPASSLYHIICAIEEFCSI